MLTASVFGVFGLVLGSFLNVVVIRRATRSLAGRSGCFSCGAQIRAYDLIPVISWLYLSGRCRICGSGISIQYPLVEISTGILFALIGGALLPPFTALLYAVIASLLIIISAYDARHTIIPDEWAYGFSALALFSIFAVGSEQILFALLAGPVAALPIFALSVLSRGRWMGLGDAKLCLGIGWLLGPVWGIYAVFFAFVIGAVISLTVLLPLPAYVRALRKAGIARGVRLSSYTMKSEVPFGPFLILSCFIVWFSLLYSLPLPGAPF